MSPNRHRLWNHQLPEFQVPERPRKAIIIGPGEEVHPNSILDSSTSKAAYMRVPLNPSGVLLNPGVNNAPSSETESTQDT
jgi:hypothetical protein